MAAIPSTQVVYFFFEETASEFDFFEELYISRVARVCKVCPHPPSPGLEEGWLLGSQWEWGRGGLGGITHNKALTPPVPPERRRR